MFEKHRIALLEQIIRDQRMEFTERVAEIKSAHTAELNRVIEERDRLRDDLDRTRLFLNPGLANVNTSRIPDISGPPVPQDVPVGGAWARVLAREKKLQEEQAATDEAEKRRRTAETAAKSEAPDGQSEQVSRPH